MACTNVVRKDGTTFYPKEYMPPLLNDRSGKAYAIATTSVTASRLMGPYTCGNVSSLDVDQS